jgi:RimJ/RimL family protein N-acetyltransferase
VFEIFFEEAIVSRGAFAVIDQQNDRIMGSTRFQPVPESKNAVEIGWTFLARAYWGGRYNHAMKSLMLDHAFRFVDNALFYIGGTNWRSQRAVEKLGARVITELDGITLNPRDANACIFRLPREEWKKSQPQANSI